MNLLRMSAWYMCTSLIAALIIFLIPSAAAAPDRKIPITVVQRGSDQIGALFTTAFNRELSHSTRYGIAPSGVTAPGGEFFVELISVDAATTQEQRKRSVISLVIQKMGFPKDYPVADMWYHKVIVVDRLTVNKSAKDFLDDIDATFCNYTTNSVGGCPKEKFQLPQ
jgi:hypothetical protein